MQQLIPYTMLKCLEHNYIEVSLSIKIYSRFRQCLGSFITSQMEITLSIVIHDTFQGIHQHSREIIANYIAVQIRHGDYLVVLYFRRESVDSLDI